MKKPTFEEVQFYCLTRRNGIDPAAFIDYYVSVGWVVGRKPMKDWQAAVRTWERNRKQVIKIRTVLEDLNDRSWAD